MQQATFDILTKMMKEQQNINNELNDAQVKQARS
jgi:hypothetical protein